MAKYEITAASTEAISTSTMMGRASRLMICQVVAPSTLRVPISRVRISVVNDARPNRPRQAMKMQMAAKMAISFSSWFSDL